ncbi:MAG TPA: UDP-glucose/GDP-mannose dehydrogenase family protein, partial [Bacteroidota bacterium]|nr:UDP-glucose/GDP-mannose dehydrogenase family protein [Bacteroidota bacterium]
RVREAIGKETDLEFDVVSNPEFLKEGNAVNDFMKPDRVVVGSSSPRATAVMQDLYGPYVRTGNPVIVMDEHSSELTKYAANAFLATKISFMNEIANLCDRVGADVELVRKGIGSDQRIGVQFLFPGVGYGGSCFPKDVSALEQTSRDYRYDFKILSAVQHVNRDQRIHFFNKISKYFRGKLKGKTIAVWGLAFKPNTDDMREAPAITIVNQLLKHGAKVHVHDPIAIDEGKRHFGNKVKYFDNNYLALKGASALAVITEWNEFRRPDFKRMKSLLKVPVIFDGRNIYDPNIVRGLGFEYFGVGRGIADGEDS